MKPLKPVLIILVIGLVLLLSSQALALIITIPDKQGNKHETSTVSINIDDKTNIVSIDFIVDYDGSILTASEAKIISSTQNWDIAQKITLGRIKITIINSIEPIEIGAIVEIDFTVNASASVGATSPLTLTQALVNEGNISSTLVSGTFTVENNLPSAQITVCPESGTACGTVNFQGQGSDVETSTNNLVLKWDLDNDGEYDDGTGSAVTWTYNNYGEHIVSLKVTDTDGNSVIDTCQIIINLMSGDVSGNCSVSGYDGALVLQHTVGLIILDEYQKTAGDVDQNKELTPMDASYIIQYVVGNIDELPVQDTSAAPVLNSSDEFRLLSKAIEQLENISLTKAQKQVLEQLKDLVFGQLTPKSTVLFQNFPNPFNPETWIPFQLKQDADVAIKIYDVRGRLVRTLLLDACKAGIYHTRDKAAYWDGKNEFSEKSASGIYFYQLKTNNFSALRRMVLVK